MAETKFTPEEIEAFKAYEASQAPKEFTEAEIEAFKDYEAKIVDQTNAAISEQQSSPVVGGVLGASIPIATGVTNQITKLVPTAKNIARHLDIPDGPEVVQGSGARNWNLAETGVAAPGTQMNKAGMETNNRLASIVQPGGPFAGGEVTPGGIAISPQSAQEIKTANAKRTPMAKVKAGMAAANEHPATQFGGKVAGGYGMGSNAMEAYNRLAKGDPSLRNKIAGYINAAGSGAGAVGMAIPERYAKYRLPAVATSGALEWLANQVAEDNKKAGGGRIGTLAELAKPVIKKLSEALGDVGSEGKNLATTQADRTIVGKGQKGGPGFPGLQHTDPEHAAANAAWAVGKPEPATMMVNANKRDPQGGLIWTNYVGSPNQHVSNPMVLGEMWDAFMKAAKEGKLSPEQLKKMNARLSSDVKGNLFDTSVDITDPRFLDAANTFEKRRLAGDVIGGEGVGGVKGRIIPYDDILNSYTDPAFIGQPTGVIGNRLFTLDNTITHNPDIHGGFPYVLGGKDLNVQFAPVPGEIGMRDFVAGKLKQKADKGVKPEMGTYDWIRGTPIQPVTEDYLTFLQKEGHAKGGKVASSNWGAGIDPEKAKANLNKKTSEAKWNAKNQLVTPSGRIISEAPSAADAALAINQFMPVTGDIQSGAMALDDLSKKQYGSAALNAVGLLPFIPSLGGTIKNVGGNWNPIAQKNIEESLGRLSQNADVSNWANTTGRKYILNRLGTFQDEVKQLFDKGITHITPNEISERAHYVHSPHDSEKVRALADRRYAEGFPEEGTATTPAGKVWEDVTDASIAPRKASYFQENADLYHGGMPDWVGKLDPNATLHDESFFAGLPDISGIDKLTAALEKDIAAGKLHPSQLNQMSIEGAVRRAHQHRAESDAAAESVAQAVPKVREYPEGYAWHDLTHEDPATLETILGKEGSTMQNCVGESCSDILENGTKIYSLRDAHGNPHVNIEVIPPTVNPNRKSEYIRWEDAPEQMKQQFSPKVTKRMTDNPGASYVHPERMRVAIDSDFQPKINQIKGKQNNVAVGDYHPYVQDFINNPVRGNAFSEIKDIASAGMEDADRIRKHGLAGNSMSPYYGELDRIFPSERGVLSGPHGVKIPETEMLRMATQDLPGKYITQEGIINHLMSQEARPLEQSYSKYYENQDMPHMAGGGKVGAVKALIENAPKIYQGAKDLILPPAENAARTQIIGTLPTYQKAGEMFQNLGGQGKALDFGAGLGEGAKILGADTFEPYAKNWTPTYSNVSDIPSNEYRKLTNLNVLNVMPREMRDQSVSDIGRVMDRGGLGILTTRGKDVMNAQGRPGPEPTSIITSRDTYQKGFTPQELEDYLKYMLGSKFEINKVNLGPAGAVIRKK